MIGLALVFVLIVAALSVAAAVALALGDRTLRRRGPRAERTAATVAAVAPVAVALVVVVALLVHGAVAVDHCDAHDHHAHLCLAHGGGWLELAWAVAAVGAAAATVGARATLLALRYLATARAMARLRRVGTRVDDVWVVDSPRTFCFVAGLRRPQIYASTAAWHGLDRDERAAVLAHERGHIAHGDLVRRLGLELALLVAAPLVGAGIVRRWAHATERLRDRDAAQQVGDPEPVARALVRMCRLSTRVATVGFGLSAADEVAGRVDALLADDAPGHRVAAIVGTAALTIVVVVAVIAATHAGPLHHALESLLG